MFKKENLLKLLIGIVVLLILGAITVALALDPNIGLVQRQTNNDVVYSENIIY